MALNYFPSEEEDAEEVKKLIEKAGQKAVLLPGDLNRREVCAEIVEKAVDELGGLDVLVLAAGRQTACPDLAELSDAQLLETFQVNVFSMFWTVKAALPHLPTGSSIITTSSIQAYQPSKYLLDYAATKGAIVCFTRALAKQLADRGIRANSVAPGPIWTPLQICGGQLPGKHSRVWAGNAAQKSRPAGGTGFAVRLSGVERIKLCDGGGYGRNRRHAFVLTRGKQTWPTVLWRCIKEI